MGLLVPASRDRAVLFIRQRKGFLLRSEKELDATAPFYYLSQWAKKGRNNI